MTHQFVTNEMLWLDMFQHTMEHGYEIRPRGEKVIELRDFTIRIDPYLPFMNFEKRNYNLEYFKAEMRWKLGASKYDDSIKQHAKMWDSVQNPDGSFNSNYGQYWFGDQLGLMHAVHELMRDYDSRRAVIPMLSVEHMRPWTKDTVCTESVTFAIRNNRLEMTVHMRSSDQIFGLGTDIPTFSVLMMLAHGLLKMKYKELEIGYCTITATSSHIYERHFAMVNQIIADGCGHMKAIRLPGCSSDEAMLIIASRGGALLRQAGELGQFILGAT